MLPFLPGLCKHLLGEELKLANAETWWCGQPRELAHVEKNLERFVIKRAFLGGAGQPVFGRGLSAAQRAELLSRVRSAPQEYAAQTVLSLSAAPVFTDGRMEHRPLVMRCYIVPDGDDFSVMPGGLTRVSPSPEALVVSMQSGGISKDTWVLSDEPVEHRSLLSATNQVVHLERMAGEVPSPINPPSGCTFHPRCPLANARCSAERPEFTRFGAVAVACHAVEEGREAA